MTDTTPPKAPVLASLKSTPNAAGSAIVSDNIAVNGVRVRDIRPWIALDVENEVHCEIDVMLKDLLHECRDSPGPDKGKLFNTCLKTVVPICNDNAVRKSLTKYTARCKENQSYSPFVKAANTSLLQLKGMNIPGVVACGGNDRDKAAEHSDILLHHNDKPMNQSHQGEMAIRKPDIVIVSENTAREALSEANKKQTIQKEKLYIDIACDQPAGNFEWTDVMATMEFKRTPATRALKPPPPSYKAGEYNRPAKEKDVYLKFNDDDEAEEAPAVEPPLRRSGRIASKEGSNKRTSSHLGNNEGSSSKRLKANPVTDDKPDLHPNIQSGVYAAEKFAAHIGLQRVLNCVVKNDMIYLWHIDRQRAIQCSGFNFVQDYARFLVLLLILQRLPYAAWGYNSTFEPEGKSPKNGWSPVTKVGSVDLSFKTDERSNHYGLRGRATNVMPVKSKYLSKKLDKMHSQNASKGLIAKLYWPEDTRVKEHEILEKVAGIAADEEKVNGHVPEMVWWHKFDETSTANIREALGIPDAKKGSRVLYIIVFRELRPITELTGKQFLKAWWDAVQCHRVLWKKGVYHRDIAPSNIMYYWTADGKVMVVLNDYDLSSISHDGPSGNERTGTVPFMAMHLLSPKGLRGEVEHSYQHDAESFIWVLTWVCLRYGKGGKLVSNPEERPLERWLKADAAQCRKEKSDFMTTGRKEDTVEPSPAHENSWNLAQSCLTAVGQLYALFPIPNLDDEHVFQTWFAEVPSYLS